VKTPDTKATSRAAAIRHLHGIGRHLRSNVVAYLALVVAAASGGGYALAATTSSATIAVCVDKGSGVMHLAKHPRCGRGQSRIGLSSALDRPTVSAWAAAIGVNGYVASAHGAVVTQEGPGLYQVKVTAPSCRFATNNAPVVSVNEGQPPAGLGGNPGAFPLAWTQTASSGIEAFTIHTGVVVNGQFQPRNEAFNFTDSCG
jgi:hypothetical protein